jgi:hypothetical protein
MAADEKYLLWDVHDVALGNVDEDDFNTLVLSGIDIVVPVEMDIDDDPLQDDEVRLRSEDGYYDAVLRSSDPDVEPDAEAGYLNYCFRLVPPGVYRVSVRVREHWSLLVRGLVVKRDGVYINGEQQSDQAPTDRPAATPTEESEEEPAAEPYDCGH